jgi:hypothetical protein
MPNKPTFDTIGDEPLEARIVAWVLGETSAFEAAELERLCDERPELLVFRRRMRALHGLLTEAEAAESDHSTKLPPEKRKLLDDIFGEDTSATLLEAQREARIRSGWRHRMLAIAACLLLLVVLGGLAAPRMLRMSKNAAVAMHARTSSQPSSSVASEVAINELKKAVREQEDKVEERRKVLASIVRSKGIIYRGEGADDDNGARSALDTFNQVETEKRQTESMLQNLLKYDKDQLMTYASGLQLPDNAVQTLYPKYIEQKSKLESLKKQGVGDQHPELQAQQQVTESMKKQLDEGVVQLRDTLQAKLELAEARYKRAAIAKNEKRSDAIKRGLDAQDYSDAKREFESEQDMLQQLKLKLIDRQISRSMPDQALALNDAAAKPAPSVSPRSTNDTRVHLKTDYPPELIEGTPKAILPELKAIPYEAPVAGGKNSLKADQPAKAPAASRPESALATNSKERAATRAKLVMPDDDGDRLGDGGAGAGRSFGGGIGTGNGAASASGAVDQLYAAPPNTGSLAQLDRKTGVPPVMEDSAFRLSADESTGGTPVSPDRRPACPPSAQPAPPAAAKPAATSPPAREVRARIAGPAPEEGAAHSLAKRGSKLEAGADSSERNATVAGGKPDKADPAASELTRRTEVLPTLRGGLTRDWDKQLAPAEIEADENNRAGSVALADFGAIPAPAFGNVGAGADYKTPGLDVDYRDKNRAGEAKDFGGFVNYGSPIQRGGESTETDSRALAAEKSTSEVIREFSKKPNMAGAAGPAATQPEAAANAEASKVMEQLDRAEPEVQEAKPAEPPALDLSAEGTAAAVPYSTFSLSISDASFKMAQAALAFGQRPDPASIKVEQFYNAVDYGDPAPSRSEPVAARVEQAAHPVIPGRNLVRVALRTAAAGRAAAQPLRLTLLVDQSGSMTREDRRLAMDNALTQLGGLLTKNDLVTVIGFSRSPRLLADALTGDQANLLSEVVNQAASEGGTNLEEALKLGEQMAMQRLTPGAQNRIVLFTDGAANLGDANPARLAEKIKALRQKGLAFDIAGFGTSELNDRLLGELARHGNGRYSVAGAEADADGSFARQLAGAFRPAAENVKVQVRFNPQRVGKYKLLGFEEHRLKTEDFRNDAVDAAELAAEEAGVALYQVEPLADGSGEIGEVSVRFRDAASGQMVERSWTIPYEASAPAFDQAAPSLQLAGLAMLAAEKLRGGPLAEAIDFKRLAAPRATVKQYYSNSRRVMEMLEVVDKL